MLAAGAGTPRQAARLPARARLAGRSAAWPRRPQADSGWTRASGGCFIRYGLAGVAAVAAAGAGGVELIDRGVLPGKGELDPLDGAC